MALSYLVFIGGGVVLAVVVLAVVVAFAVHSNQ